MNAPNRLENAKLEKSKGDNACATLLTKGLEAHSHQGMQRLFHLHFIRTKVFPEKAGVLLSHAQKAREEADYFSEISFSKEVAQERLKEVEGFLTASRPFLQNLGIE